QLIRSPHHWCAVSCATTALVIVRTTFPMSSLDFSPSLRKDRLDRKTNPGQPWLTGPGFCVIESELYGYGPKALEKKSTACAAFSATARALRAGEGGGGGRICIVRGCVRFPG